MSDLKEDIDFWVGNCSSPRETASILLRAVAAVDIESFMRLLPADVKAAMKEEVKNPPKTMDKLDIHLNSLT